MPAPAPPAIGSIVTIASRTSMPGGLKIYLPNMPKSTAAAFNHMPRCPPAASPHLAPTHPDASHTHSAHLRATRRAVPTCGGGARGRRDITQGGQLFGPCHSPGAIGNGSAVSLSSCTIVASSAARASAGCRDCEVPVGHDCSCAKAAPVTRTTPESRCSLLCNVSSAVPSVSSPPPSLSANAAVAVVLARAGVPNLLLRLTLLEDNRQ